MTAKPDILNRQMRSILLSLLISLWIVACQSSTSNFSVSSNRLSSTNCRIVKHTMGETCVPVSPQRIVVLTALDSVLVLGVKPIGAATYEMNQFRSFLTEQTEGIENIGVIGQPSLEKIVRLQPDLIMGTYPIEIYAQLSKIAPTVIFFDGDKAYSKWQNAFKAYADVLGKTQEADRILNEYQQRVGEFRARMGEQISKTQVSLVNFFATDVRIYFKQCIGGQVIEEAGFLRSPFQDKDEWSVENLSLEAIPQMAGDVIFLLLGGHEPSKLDQFIKHPLWSQLEAVQTSKVYEVSSEIWISGSTPVDANLILDDLFKHLIDK